jgi:hypothetical protein
MKLLSTGCGKCDFSDGGNRSECERGLCNEYEPSFVRVSDDEPYALSLDEFNAKYGTHYTEEDLVRR